MPVDPHEPSAPTASAGSGDGPRAALGRAEVRKLLVDVVRRRVPASDVDDVVQTVLCEALAADRVPSDREELRKWLTGIARHKIVDHHRKRAREAPAEIPDVAAAPPPVEARALARWAERQAPATDDARRTLDWMAREGEGEKLESIAAEEKLPAARVRQRVSRLRRWMKERWLAELAAVAAVALLAFALWRLAKRHEHIEAIRPDVEHAPPEPSARPAPPDPSDPMLRARALRADAAERCHAGDRATCLALLDEARALDPAGDAAPDVVDLRREATSPEPDPPKEAPKSKAPPKPTPKAAPKPTAPAPTSMLKSPSSSEPGSTPHAASKKVLGPNDWKD